MGVLGYVRKETTDVYTQLVNTDTSSGGASMTNLDVALRIQVPDGKSVFFFNDDPKSGRTAVVMSVNLPKQKK